MEPFKLVRAQNNATAIAASSSKDTKFIAGGTNIIDLMKLYIETPKQLVDITGLNLNQIEQQSGGSIRIGALVKNSTLASIRVWRWAAWQLNHGGHSRQKKY